MSAITGFRLKIRHWFRKYGKVVFVTVMVIVTIYVINKYLKSIDIQTVPNTTYEPNISVIDSRSSAPSKVQNTAEQMIEEYVEFCNAGNYQKAFDMLSDDCKKYGFNDDLYNFVEHVLSKMQTPKKFSIQNYSNYKGFYIYEVKYIDDILATGLTNQEYKFSTEKIIFTKNKNNSYDMSVGNFVKYEKIASILENDYLKIDVIDRLTRYSIEDYTVKFTNRTDSTVVISDGLVKDEVQLVLPKEYRNMENTNNDIILEPGESKTCKLSFSKFFDDGDLSQSLSFNAVRVIENYKGIEGTVEEQEKEIETAIAKFSLKVQLR